MANTAGSSLVVIRQALLALSVALVLFVAVALVLSYLTDWQVFPPLPDWAAEDVSQGYSVDATPSAGLWRLLHDWTGFEDWSGTSINVHWGSLSRTLAGSPAFTFALIAGLSISLYLLSLRLRAGHLSVDLRVIAAIFLACWVALDLLWQARLFRQLFETHSTFAGKPYAEKVYETHDALLVHFADAIKQMVPDTQARILVGSESDYFGMRGAYFLYPRNVLWQRDGPEIPPREYLRSGDHVVLIEPTGVHMNGAAGTLAVPGEQPIKVDPVMKHPAGYLFRVR